MRRQSPCHSDRHSPSHILLLDSLARSAYTEKYLGIFLSRYLLFGRYTSSTIYFDILLQLRATEKAVELGLLAISLCIIGQRDQDTGLLETGLRSYALAIREMVKLANLGEIAGKYRVLCSAAKTLSLFELLFNFKPSESLDRSMNWLAHTDGQLAMITARKPSDFREGADHQLFRSTRYPLMISAITRRKRIVISRPEWSSIPWELSPKTPEDILVDIWGEMAGLMEDAEIAQQIRCCAQREVWKAKISRALRALAGRLQCWLDETKPLKVFHEGQGPTSPEDFTLAELTITYWTTCLLLHGIVCPFINDYPEGDVQSMNASKYAYLILKGIPYFWTPAAGLIGEQITTFPLSICLHWLQLVYGVHSLDHHHPLMDLADSPWARVTPIGEFSASIWMAEVGNAPNDLVSTVAMEARRLVAERGFVGMFC
ncbi:hypothetical protein GQ53DRAFT_814682 [Thozetella sp. PMI_491]|nr:hypothetical protein GQ53DRAFT_814682 [Thozetella sp. PMI_491]